MPRERDNAERDPRDRLLAILAVAIIGLSATLWRLDTSHRDTMDQLRAGIEDATTSRRSLQSEGEGAGPGARGSAAEKCFRESEATVVALRAVDAVYRRQLTAAARIEAALAALPFKLDNATLVAELGFKAARAEMVHRLARKANSSAPIDWAALVRDVDGKADAAVVAALSARVHRELVELLALFGLKANVTTVDAIERMLGSASAEIASEEPLTLDNVTRVLEPLLAPKAEAEALEPLRLALGELAGASTVDALAAQVVGAQPTPPPAEISPCRCAPCQASADSGGVCVPEVTPCRFEYNANALSNRAAEEACRRSGGHLASIHSQDEQDTVAALIPDGAWPAGRAWNGFHDRHAEQGCDGLGFIWTDGSPTDYTNWDDGEPNDWLGGGPHCDGTGGEDCTEMYHGGTSWNDLDCDTEMPFVCKLCATPCDCVDTSGSTDPIRQTYPMTQTTPPCCAAGESGPSCVACRVVNGYRGEDPAALSSALLSRAAGSFELSVSALCSVSVHEHGAFNGWRADFINGDYDGPAFLRSGAHDNAASSVQVHGEGCVARVYESPDLGVSGGWQVSLREGEYGLAELRAAGAVDEQLSSISVFHVPPGPWRMDPTSFMTFLTVHDGQNLTLSGVTMRSDRLPTLDASITVMGGGSIIINSTYVSGGVKREDGSSYSVWAPCGDRILETWRGEECDDGDENADAADSCRLDCKLPTCGDKIVDSGEGCDQGDARAAPCRLTLSQHNAPGHGRTGWVFTTTTCGEWVTLPPDKKDDASSVVIEGDGCQMIAADGDGGASPFSSGGQVYHQGTYSGRKRMLTGNDNINSMLLSCAGNSADGTCGGSCQPTCSCQTLAAPTGGSIEYTGGHPLCGSQVAAYSCATGPLQGGDASRACGAYGVWSGTAPTHCGCPSLPAVAGMSIARSSGDVVGSVATYSCDTGSTLQGGDATRTCQANGNWTGSAPTYCGCAELARPPNGTTLTYSNGLVFPTTASYIPDAGGAHARCRNWFTSPSVTPCAWCGSVGCDGGAGDGVDRRQCGFPSRAGSSANDRHALTLQKRANKFFQYKSWKVGCDHGQTSGTLSDCLSACGSCNGCCCLPKPNCPNNPCPGDPDYCRGNSCGGGGCCAASRNICKEACAAYFDPAPDGVAEATKECGADGAWQDV